MSCSIFQLFFLTLLWRIFELTVIAEAAKIIIAQPVSIRAANEVAVMIGWRIFPHSQREKGAVR